MKKMILALIMIVFILASNTVGYAQGSAKKLVDPNESLLEMKNDGSNAKQVLKKTRKNSIRDYKIFKTESELKIKSNNRSIADLKDHSLIFIINT